MSSSPGRSGFGDAIAKFFGLKGAFAFSDVQHSVVPTINVGPLFETPWSDLVARWGVQQRTPGAVAAVSSFVGVRAAAGKALEVRRIFITEATGAPSVHQLSLLSDAAVAAWTTAAVFTQITSTNAFNQEGPVSTANTLASQAMSGNNLTNSGLTLGRVYTPANSVLALDYPAGSLVLHGNDTNRRNLVVQRETVNQSAHVWFLVREWDQPV